MRLLNKLNLPITNHDKWLMLLTITTGDYKINHKNFIEYFYSYNNGEQLLFLENDITFEEGIYINYEIQK